MKTIIAIIGKTGSGKDTLANRFKDLLHINQVVSHTTRPKRNYETNGKEHWFDTKEDFDKLVENENVIAYTINEKTKIEYCAVESDLNEDIMVYIINPNGLKYLKEKLGDKYKIFTIYVYAEESTIKKRCKDRGDKLEVFLKRLESERKEFDNFYRNRNAQIDVVIDNRDREDFKTFIDNMVIAIGVMNGIHSTEV
jgi:guanylate kinase